MRAAALAVLLAACTGAPTLIECADDAACARGGAAGRCEIDHRCSRSDAACDSGRRYDGDYAGDLADVCVPADLPVWLATVGSQVEDAPVDLAAPAPDRISVFGRTGGPLGAPFSDEARSLAIAEFDAVTGALRAQRQLGATAPDDGYGHSATAGGAQLLVRWIVSPRMIDDATFTSGGPWLMTATRTDGALRFTAALGFSTAGDASVAPHAMAEGLVVGNVTCTACASAPTATFGPASVTGAGAAFVATVGGAGAPAWTGAVGLVPRADGVSTITPLAVATVAGAPVAIGSFRGTVDFPGGQVTGRVSGGTDAFVARFGPSLGAPSVTAYVPGGGGAGMGGVLLTAIAGDAVGGVVVGSAHGRVGTIATPPVDGDNSEDPLILPLTPGWPAWRIAGTAAAAIQAAAIDGDDLWIAGTYGGPVPELGLGAPTSTADGFVAHLRRQPSSTPPYALVASRRVGGADPVRIVDLQLAAGRVVVAGEFAGTTQFGAGATRTAAGATDWFVVAYAR